MKDRVLYQTNAGGYKRREVVAQHKDPSLFFEQTRHAKRVLLLDLGFLGDSIHLLPALWTLRQAYPAAELHVMVSEHVTSIMKVASWIDKIWGYPRFPKGPRWYQEFGRVRRLRSEKFDVVINLNGSDRSSILTGLSGATWRLGMRPQRGGPAFWPLMFSHIVSFPHHTRLISEHRWECLKLAGYPGQIPEVHIKIPESSRRSAMEKLRGKDDAEVEGGWIHISPFATTDSKELPADQLAELLCSINRLFPERQLVLTCAANARECVKMEKLVDSLNFQPWRVFPGTLDLLEMAAVMQGSSLHLGGDSGGLHVAWMTGVPTVTWFREYEGRVDWQPTGPLHRSVIGMEAPGGIVGICNEQILIAVEQLKGAVHP